VFGRMCKYFGVMEISECGPFHLHGFLRLQGIVNSSSLLHEVGEEEQALYWERFVICVGNLFTKVNLYK